MFRPPTICRQCLRRLSSSPRNRSVTSQSTPKPKEIGIPPIDSYLSRTKQSVESDRKRVTKPTLTGDNVAAGKNYPPESPRLTHEDKRTIRKRFRQVAFQSRPGKRSSLPQQIFSTSVRSADKVEQDTSVRPKSALPEVVDEPGIWQPNRMDKTARETAFAQLSPETIAQAGKQLRSDWSPKTFRDVDLVAGLAKTVETSILGHLQKPEVTLTDVQALALPVITKMDKAGFAYPRELRSFLIAAETGSGKTLAYLLPLINRMKREEEWSVQNPDSENSILKTRRRASPRSLIIVPTSELAEQIYSILKRLCHEMKFSVQALLPKFSDSVIRKSILHKYIDVLISTPHRVKEFLQSGELKSDRVRYVIIDEADTLFDRSFADTMNPILSSVQRQLTHLVLCSATIPVTLDGRLRKKFPGMERIVTPKIHTAPRRIHLDVIIERDKPTALLELLRELQANGEEKDKDVKRAILFCNAKETVKEVYEYLRESEDLTTTDAIFELIPFTRDNFDRHTALERFNAQAETADMKKLRVLLTTDMASRGLDTISAKRVILYDVPYSSIDLLHRVGRTARAGTRGQAYMIVSKAEYRGQAKEWVNQIRDRVIRGAMLV
jgi:ATP-dependent RNA helicase MRH4, mitochondrial